MRLRKVKGNSGVLEVVLQVDGQSEVVPARDKYGKPIQYSVNDILKYGSDAIGKPFDQYKTETKTAKIPSADELALRRLRGE